MTASGAATASSGYRLVLPPGWVQVDLDRDLVRQVRQIVERAFAGRSPDETAHTRREVTSAMLRSLEAARDLGTRELFFPLTDALGGPLPMSIAVADLVVARQEDPMGVLLATAAQDPTARAVELDGSVALRTTRQHRSSSSDGGADEPTVAREVRYLVGQPGSKDRWRSVVFSVVLADVPEHEELAEALVELFDAVMTSFTWVVDDASDV